MTHPVFRAAVLLVAFATLVSPCAALAQEARILIRMYDVAATGPELRAEAMRTAASIVSDAGVAVRWMDCSRGGADHPCRTVAGARELVVRIMPVPENGVSRSRQALSIRGISGATNQQLGFAAVGDPSRRGILATVYYESVRAVAQSSGVVLSRLLGRAIAHEVGHLLLPRRGHSPTGLMRAPWAFEELTEDRREDWVFSPMDGRQLRVAAGHQPD
jgi:hypothetical protein